MIMAGTSSMSAASASALGASFDSSAPAAMSLAASRARTVRLKLMGAHRLSGHTQQVRLVQPQSLGTGTPHSTLPVMRKGTSALPERKRTPPRFSTSCASSRSRQLGNATVKELLLPSGSMTVCAGSSSSMASNASRNLFWM